MDRKLIFVLTLIVAVCPAQIMQQTIGTTPPPNLAFYAQDILINMNGTSTGTAVTTANLATGTQGTNTTWSTASAQETFAVSQVVMPANVTVNSVLFSANVATQSLAYNLTTAVTASKKSIPGSHSTVTTSGWFLGPPSCGACGTLYDLSYAAGTNIPIASALQITPGTGATCGQYAVRIEATHTAAHSGCINISASSLYFWSMYTNMSAAGTCQPGSVAAPCAELSIYTTSGAVFTQVGSTVSVALNTAGTSDTLSYVNYGQSETQTASATMYFQNMMINYSNAVEGQPNVPH